MTAEPAKHSGTLLVTGGSGFIGRRLVRMARAAGMKISAPTCDELDLSDALATRSFVENLRPAAVVHLASAGVFAPNPDAPELVDNEISMLRPLLDVAPSGCRIVTGGSMAEYGQSGRLEETMSCSPQNAYARAKYEIGQMLLRRLNTGEISGCHARIFGAFGTGEASRRLMPMVVARLERGDPVPLSDGRQVRDFVHVDDVADALLKLVGAEDLVEPVINIGTGKGVQMRMAVERVADELGAPRELLQFGEVARSPHDQDVLEADVERLRKATGTVPDQHFLGASPILPLL